MYIYMNISKNLYTHNYEQHNHFKTIVDLNLTDLSLFNLRRACAIPTENKWNKIFILADTIKI